MDILFVKPNKRASACTRWFVGLHKTHRLWPSSLAGAFGVFGGHLIVLAGCLRNRVSPISEELISNDNSQDDYSGGSPKLIAFRHFGFEKDCSQREPAEQYRERKSYDRISVFHRVLVTICFCIIPAKKMRCRQSGHSQLWILFNAKPCSLVGE